ncbi:MAG: hypothetical protein ACE5KG_01740 [Nitrososphaerales archaeon]
MRDKILPIYTVSKEEEVAEPRDQESQKEDPEKQDVYVPMPKLEEKTKPKKKKVLRTKIEEAVSSKGE